MDFRFWRKKDRNKWVETDERERWSVIVGALALIIAVIAGIWLLVYSLTR